MSLRNAKCQCGKDIDENDYISKGPFDYCSPECAEKFEGNKVRQKPSEISEYTGDWQMIPTTF